MIKILPSILTSDFTDVNKDIEIFRQNGIDEIHLDVMDGNFVPTITFGPKYICDLKMHNNDIKFDTHLMISNPIKHFMHYVEVGSNAVTIHIETSKEKDIIKMAKIAKDKNVKFGLSLNPETNVKKLEKILRKADCDIILIMSVHPGAGGQKFIKETLDKALYLTELKKEKNYNYVLEIDGGINLDTIKDAIDSNIERIVVGSAIYKDDNIAANINEFNNKIKLIAGND